MSAPGWYNANQSRSYPIVGPGPILMTRNDLVSLVLPATVLVDAGFLAQAGNITCVMYLAEIRRISATRFQFRVGSTVPELADWSFQQDRDLSLDPEFTPRWSSAMGGTSSVCDSLVGDLLWDGFLTTGQLQDLVPLLTVGQSLTGSPETTAFEPSSIQWLAGTRLQSINLANEDRTRWTASPSCGGTGLDPGRQYLVAGRCLSGPLELIPGYNCVITQTDRNATLTIGAQVGGGLGVPCREVPLTPSEAELPDNVLLSGGPSCSEAINRINGLVGPELSLVGGQGVQIQPSTVDESGLVVDVNLFDVEVCGDASQ
jgi:hypothetical protein